LSGVLGSSLSLDSATARDVATTELAPRVPRAVDGTILSVASSEVGVRSGTVYTAKLSRIEASGLVFHTATASDVASAERTERIPSAVDGTSLSVAIRRVGVGTNAIFTTELSGVLSSGLKFLSSTARGVTTAEGTERIPSTVDGTVLSVAAGEVDRWAGTCDTAELFHILSSGLVLNTATASDVARAKTAPSVPSTVDRTRLSVAIGKVHGGSSTRFSTELFHILRSGLIFLSSTARGVTTAEGTERVPSTVDRTGLRVATREVDGWSHAIHATTNGGSGDHTGLVSPTASAGSITGAESGPITPNAVSNLQGSQDGRKISSVSGSESRQGVHLDDVGLSRARVR